MDSRFASTPASRRPTAGVVLAAGASARFHGYPKACLSIDGEAGVRRIVRLATDAGIAPVAVVTGPHEPEIRRALAGTAVHIVSNLRWSAGRTGSVQAGLDALPETTDVLVWPVDHPLVGGATVSTLLDVAARDPLALWVLPMYRGVGGHPVVIRQEARAFVRDLAPADPLRAAVTHLGPQVRRLPVDDPGVVANLDSPEQYREMLGRWRDGWTGG